jgi:nitric oxide dioxygenase
MSLSPEQVQIIRSTVPALQAHGNAITTRFYSTLLSEVPSLNAVFNQANQANDHQAQALASALYAYALHVDDLGALSPAIEKICHKHASLYIKAEHYAVVGEYLLRAMGDVLGSALTPDILSAWATAYEQLAGVMIAREAELTKSTRGWDEWREFVITKKSRESDEITSFYLEPVDKKPLPLYRPGQYISVLTHVPQLQYEQSRQYSLSGAPNHERYRISVKKEKGIQLGHPDAPTHPGYISNVLHDRKSAGDLVKVSHPFGEFFWDPEADRHKPVVLLSAGVGITPLIAILDTMVAQGAEQRISFVHASRSSSVRAFSEHMREVAASHSNVTYTSFIKSPLSTDVEGHDYHKQGRLQISALDMKRDLLTDHNDALYFICGPESFMTESCSALQKLGISRSQIRLEIFGTGATPSL